MGVWLGPAPPLALVPPHTPILQPSSSPVCMYVCMYVCMMYVCTYTADLKSVAMAVAGIDLTDHVVEFIIAVCDEDGRHNVM